MSRLYACIVSEHPRESVSIAQRFAYGVELLEDAVLLDISGTEKLFGTPLEIASLLERELKKKNIAANISIASNGAAALLHARNHPGISIVEESATTDLPLSSLDIEPDILDVFSSLGLKSTADIDRIETSDLIARYGSEFQKTIDLIKNKSSYVLTSNIKEDAASWSSEFDFRVEDFEQLIFILSTGVEKILTAAAQCGSSTEHIHITLRLNKNVEKSYDIKLSFPTLNRKFWQTIISLRIGNDPPESEIVAMSLTAHFTKQRSVQRGMFASTRPEPEALQLTVDKIKRLLGDKNVGVPVLLNERLPKPFLLDEKKIPSGTEEIAVAEGAAVLALCYFDPPLLAEVMVNKKKLLYVRTGAFEGRVAEYGGVWKGSSQWWNPRRWHTQEWDIELEDKSLYCLQKNGQDWFVTGRYD